MATTRTKKTQLEKKFLTPEELQIFQSSAWSPFFFAQFIMLIHPLRGKVPFKLYPFQEALLAKFIKNHFNVVLKFRQAGVTELISLFCLWYAMFHPFKNIVIISIKDRVAKKVLRKIKFMYKNLPACLQVPIVNGRKFDDYGTQSEMEFSNGSIIASIPTTEEAGRSEAVSLLVIDEAAIVRWAEKIWAAAWPTLSTGGRAIVNSTAYGIGNFFHKLYTNAFAGGNQFEAIRLHWQMHPERYRFEGDMEWYNSQLEILGPRKTAQEIDGDFLTSGNTVFDLTDIKEIEDLLAEGLIQEDGTSYKVLRTEMNGMLKVFEDPKPGMKYVMGMDIATGRAQDYTTFTILDKKGDEKVCFKGRITIDKAEELGLKWGRKYNNAILAPESNDVGLGVAMGFQSANYPNLYYSRKLLKKKNQSRPDVEEIPGWYTTKKNRPVIIAELEEDVRTGALTLKDQNFCIEAYTFIYDERNRPVALNKGKENDSDVTDDETYTDDSIIAKAIANRVRKEKISTVIILPE